MRRINSVKKKTKNTIVIMASMMNMTNTEEPTMMNMDTVRIMKLTNDMMIIMRIINIEITYF